MFSAEDALETLRAGVPDLDDRVASRQLEIIEARAWYMKEGRFDPETMLASWVAMEKAALSRGFAGARISGGTCWIERKEDFKSFVDYEERLSAIMKQHRIVCLCSYSLPRSQAADVLDVLRVHTIAIARRNGDWEVAEPASLKVAKDELRQTQEEVRLRDEFISVAAHELNTPLHTLQLVVQGVNNGTIPLTPDTMTSSFKLIVRQVKRLVGLVDQLLDVARMRAGGLTLYYASVDLVEVVNDMLEQLRGELDRAGCAVNLRAPATPLVGQWDRQRVEQIVANLLSNAAKFAPGAPIDVTLEEVGDAARLVIRDHGIGIPPERLPHIFDRFERAVSARQYGGLGLGLYIVRTILAAMGGTVRVESAASAGSTFIIELPRAPLEPK